MTDVSPSEWYLGNASGERDGPFSTTQVVHMRQSGRIGDDTPCWRQGMDNWMPFDRVPSLVALIDSQKRRARRRMWTVATWLVVCTVLIGVGVFVFKQMMVPEAVARAEEAIAQQRYLAAGQSLRPYLEENGYKNPHALTLMGVAALGYYATGDPNDRADTSGYGWGVRQQQMDTVKLARDAFERAFERDPSWRDFAGQYVHGIIGAIPEDAPDLCNRCARICELLADLGIADPSDLAQQALTEYRGAVGGTQQACCSQDFAEVVLLGEPKLSGEFISAVYRFRFETPAGKRLGPPGNEFVSWTENNPKLTPSLCTGLAEHAKTAGTAGNYTQCDDALAALCRIDGELALKVHELVLPRLAKSGAFTNVGCREIVVRRLNGLADTAGIDVRAVTDLYLAHRTELVSFDSQLELHLCHQLREATRALGSEHFLRSGKRLLAAGNYAAAVAELNRIDRGSEHYAAAAAPFREAEFQLQLKIGKESLQAGQHATAEKAFRSALEINPDDETATAGLDQCLQIARQQAIDNGIDRVRSLIETGRPPPLHRSGLQPPGAGAYGQFDEARSILAKLMADYPDEPAVVAEWRSLNKRLAEARLEGVRRLITQGDLVSAEAELLSILADMPENAAATQLLDQVQSDLVAEDCERAASSIARKQYVEAQAAIALALKRRPTDGRALALDNQVTKYMDDPETTDLSGIWSLPCGTRIVLAQEGDQVSITAETRVADYTTWEGTWTRDGKALSGTFQVAVRGMAETASIDVRAAIQDSKTIKVLWEKTTWLNTQKTRGRGHGEIAVVRISTGTDAPTETTRDHDPRRPVDPFGLPSIRPSPGSRDQPFPR